MTDSQCQPADFPLDDVFRLLSHPTRRALIHRLRGTETTNLESIATQLAEADGRYSEEFEFDERMELAIAELYHVHLPKMAAVGMIEFDPVAGTIETNETAEAVYDVLDLVEGECCG